jgi:hypothetical protein
MLLNTSISANLAMSKNYRWENCLLQFHWYHRRRWTFFQMPNLTPSKMSDHSTKLNDGTADYQFLLTIDPGFI